MNAMNKQNEAASIETVLRLDRKPGKRSRLWWVLAVSGVAAIAFYFLGQGKETRAVYVTTPSTKGDLTMTVTATGTVFPINQVDVGSELSGIIRKVHVNYNDPVKVGDVLAELDTVTLTAQVERSRASLASANASVVQAEATVNERSRNYERQKSLNTQRYSSENTLDVAKADYERAVASVSSAKANVRVAEAELKQNETNLAKTKLYSPVTGVVLKRSIEPGQTVAASFQAPILFTLAEDLRNIELRVDIDEADVGKVRQGQAATFSVEAYQGKKFPARIQQLRFASETVNNVVTYKAVLRAENPDLALRPGMTVTAEIVVEEVRDAVLIPNAALRFVPPAPPKKEKSGGGFTLFRMPRTQPAAPAIDTTSDKRVIHVLANGQPQPVSVRVGASDKRSTQVVEGLEAGAPVILELDDQVPAK